MNLDANYMKEYKNDSNLIRWEVNKNCNFHCNYCDIWKKEDEKAKIQIDITKLQKGLECFHGNWRIDITGGEPFLEKNFVEICQVLTEKHFISINTNLSTSNVFDFAEKISPEKCKYFNASVHIAEREKSDKGLKIFIEKIRHLQYKGFYPTAIYVTHPNLFERMKSDIAYLETNGVERVHILIFRGWHKEKLYPVSYTTAQRALLLSMNAYYLDFEVLNNKHFDFYGHLCHAGQNFFVMDREGNIRRCTSIDKSYGNLFEKTIRFDKKIKPCSQKNYLCPYECLEFGLDKKANRFSILKDRLVSKYLT
jgi:MoaA/NifB/PqqE/SkfB family radical SAM enzyme